MTVREATGDDAQAWVLAWRAGRAPDAQHLRLSRGAAPPARAWHGRRTAAGMTPDEPSALSTSPRFARVLVGTDFSAQAAYGLTVALNLAARLGAALTLLHVREFPVLAATDGMSVPVVALQEAAEAALEAAGREARACYPRVETMLADGEPARAILEAAARASADLIVVGTHGRSGLERLLLGSVAEQVLRRASIPVLVVSASAARRGRDAGATPLG